MPLPPGLDLANAVGADYLKAWNQYWEYTKTPEFKTQVRSQVLAPDFLKHNYLSTELRIPVTLLGTNVCSPLATNAIKYGALSTPTGRIEINWSADQGQFRWMWRERGGPPVAAPTQTGFGSRLIAASLKGELAGSSRFDYAPGGLTCVLTILAPPRGA